jgi:hypothetical protein
MRVRELTSLLSALRASRRLPGETPAGAGSTIISSKAHVFAKLLRLMTSQIRVHQN